MGLVSFNDEPEQYLCAAVLCPGNVTAPVGAVGILRRLLIMVRCFSRTFASIHPLQQFDQLLQHTRIEPALHFDPPLPGQANRQSTRPGHGFR